MGGVYATCSHAEWTLREAGDYACLVAFIWNLLSFLSQKPTREINSALRVDRIFDAQTTCGKTSIANSHLRARKLPNAAALVDHRCTPPLNRMLVLYP